MLRAASLLVVLLAASTAASATGDAMAGDAKRLFDAGSLFYARGQYPPAIRAFEEAMRQVPLPAIGFSLAQAIRLQYFVDHDAAKLRRAIELYRGYIAATPAGGRRGDAVSMIAELEPILHRLDSERVRAEPVKPAPPSPTELLVTSSVEGAMVSIDGGAESELPLDAVVSAGAHQIRVTHPDYFPASERATAVEGRLVTVEVALKPRPALLALSGDEGVELSLDGRVLAKTPVAIPVELEAGQYHLRFSRSGREPLEQTIDLSRGETRSIAIDLSLTTQRRWAYGLMLGSALAMAGSATFVGLGASDDSVASDLFARREAGGISAADADRYDDLRRTRDAKLTVGFAVGGAAVALLATGIGLLLAD